MSSLSKIMLFVLLFLCTGIGYSQQDSLKQKKPFFTKNKIVPLSLIGAGLYVNFAGGSLGKIHLQNNIQDGTNFKTRADEFLQYGPAALLYSANLFGVKSKNNIETQSINIAIIGLSNFLVIKSLKTTITSNRPNGGKNSFPSGHTTYAFSLARQLELEYKDSSPILAYSGYAIAATTGAFRVLNNKHWVSDVLVGAGMGILITDVIYRIQPFKSKKLKKHKNLNAIFVPTINQNTFGFTGVITF